MTRFGALALLATACVVDPVDFSSKQCPCDDGFTCDSARNVCVETGAIVPCSAPRSSGSTYYVAAGGGSDASDGRASERAWATFAHAWTVLSPGDTLVLLDGTYTEPLAPTVSGTLGQDIRVCSDTDGGAIIDGEGARIPCVIDGADDAPLTYVTIEGVVCRRSSGVSISLSDARHIALRRVSAYESASSAGAVVEVFEVFDSLFEDLAVAGAGSGLSLTSSHGNTVRRVWARWESADFGYSYPIVVQWSGDNLVENCVSTAGPSPANFVVGFQFYIASGNTLSGSVAWTDTSGEMDLGISVSAEFEQTRDNSVSGSVVIGAGTGLSQRSDLDLPIDRVTLGTADVLLNVNPASADPEPGFSLSASITSSVLLDAESGISVASSPYVGAFTHTNNDIYGVTTPYSGADPHPTELAIDPGYDLARYGMGAYLIAPASLATSGVDGGGVGADVRYREVDGELTTQPLWPWPMEDRILRETGQSVTWAANGGLWATLDGVYP